ncbi:hypothetical protein Goshw_017393 [Gossypium schwendimanii]|uniref:Uncharacterized protein n=1 Tax=Gossypium schwendimanii TaxID=34291 RepID=A0A7J9N2E3_GOSSC|nr:hypothetical protein [Gossypium schwendimanii]
MQPIGEMHAVNSLGGF